MNIEKLATKEGLISVTRTLGKASPKGEEKKLNIRPFVTSTAAVAVKKGVTLNPRPGSYELMRIEVLISVPCYVEEIVPVFNRTRDLVDDLLQKEIDIFEESLESETEEETEDDD
jgi:hypothetical protein